MTFDSLHFGMFLAICFAFHWGLGSSRLRSVQNIVLLVANLWFYATWDFRALLLVVSVVVWTWFVGMYARRLRWLATVGVLGLIALLGVFKYYDFFITSIQWATDVRFKTLNLILPIGISFYVFQAIGYIVDVAKGEKIDCKYGFVEFAVFMTFFPQILAGPIERAASMLPQFSKRRIFNESFAVEGCRQILWGAFAKFVVADNFCTITETLLGCSSLSAGMAWCGAVGYAVQIYADFSGYSNMAIGIGKLLGVRLRQNFAYPYFATGFSDFWRRWHISLTTWFRDYVYFPLGGSRCPLVKTLRNIWIVFLLSGLWHGAAWTFVAWGAIHALFLSIERLFKGIANKAPDNFANGIVSRTVMLLGVIIAWLVFRAADFGDAWRCVAALFDFCKGAVWPKIPQSVYAVAVLGAAAMFVKEYAGRGHEFGLKKVPCSRIVRWSLYLVLAALVICCNGGGSSFIYQKF